MWQEERYRRIRKMLEALQSVAADRIAQELGVSRETVRRDLIALEAAGELRRAHGGAVSNGTDASPTVRPSDLRHQRAVVRAAAGQLANGQTLFMEAGSLAGQLAEALAGLHDFTLITNSFEAALRLASSARINGRANRVVMLGGLVQDGYAATQGEHVIAEIHRYTVDVALLMPTAIESRNGATHDDLARAELGRAIAANARRVIVLADDSRVGRNAGIAYCAADRIGTFVTNKKSEAGDGYEALAEAVGNVVLA